MNRYEEFTSARHRAEIEAAHETALHAEKNAKVLAKQALKMASAGETAAIAKRPLGEAVAKTLGLSDQVSEHYDNTSVELATNARLRDQGVEVEMVPPEPDFEMVMGRAGIKVKSIDGHDVE